MAAVGKIEDGTPIATSLDRHKEGRLKGGSVENRNNGAIRNMHLERRRARAKAHRTIDSVCDRNELNARNR